MPNWMKQSDLFLAMGLLMIISVMVIPLPPLLLDVFLSLEIAISVILLLTAVYATRALDFSIFPSLLLITTLFRLSLNVATTRIILLYGPERGIAAAGEVIRAFGEFVVGGNYAVGIVVFAILVIINFVVITKGAGRVAEVAARFTLDAMPGKQMAIDADLNAGMINEEEARRRRAEIAREGDFYGAMDGASKFVRGDAIAGILIVVVNVIGGIVIGTLQRGMGFAEAVETFSLLTVGDGLVTQIPALIVSTAAGIMVTRTATSTHFSQELSKQLVMKPGALSASAGVMMFLAFVPGLPFFPFMLLAGGIGGLSFVLKKKEREVQEKEVAKVQAQKLKPGVEKLESLLNVDLLELEVGYGLVPIVDASQKGDLLERVSHIRKQFALDFGMIIPPLRIRDNLELKPGDYRILLKGIVISEATLMPGNFLAMDPGGVSRKIRGVPTKEPAFGLDALWVTERQKDDAQQAGYTVVDLSTVIATHLTEVIRTNIHELLGRQEVQVLLDTLKTTAPKVIEELIPNVLSVTSVAKVLRNLLREGVSIRDLRTILETLGEAGVAQKDAQLLTEHVRAALARVITRKLVTPEGILSLLTLERDIEESLASTLIHTDRGQQLSVDPDYARSLIGAISEQVTVLAAKALSPVLLVSPVIRPHLKDLLDRFIPNVTVLSHNEITPNVTVKSEGMVRLAHAG
jgi:flagellar biosynthesis protein FlhA